MRFLSLAFIIRFSTIALSFSFAMLATYTPTSASDQETLRTFIYDSANGNLSLETDGQPLNTLQIESKSGVFTGEKPLFLNQRGLFEPNRLIDLRTPTIPDTSYGPAMKPGLSLDFLTADLTITQFPAGNTLLAAKGYTPRILHYDSTTGALSLDAPIGIAGETKVSSLVIDSTSGIFTGSRPTALTNSFDVFRPNRLFKIDVAGFNSISLDMPATPSLTETSLIQDLCIAGSLVGGGSLHGVRLNSARGPLVNLCETIPDFGGPAPTPHSVRFDYNPIDGRLIMTVSGSPLTALELKSPLNLFTGTRPSEVNGLFDVFTPAKFFILKPNGISSTDFGPILPRGLAPDDLLSIAASGAVKPFGSLGNVSFGYLTIPEPSMSSVMGMMLGIISGHRRTRRNVR